MLFFLLVSFILRTEEEDVREARQRCALLLFMGELQQDEVTRMVDRYFHIEMNFLELSLVLLG